MRVPPGKLPIPRETGNLGCEFLDSGRRQVGGGLEELDRPDWRWSYALASGMWYLSGRALTGCSQGDLLLAELLQLRGRPGCGGSKTGKD
jgi:hypothetical protein